MEFNEMLDVMLYCMRYYDDLEFKNHFGLFEYYSMTDISPKELAKVVRKLGKVSLAANILALESKNTWTSLKCDKARLMNCGQKINGKYFTDEDKLTIIETLEKEGYPLIDSVYYGASRRYGYYGVDGILKETTRNKLIKFYCESNGITSIKNTGLIEKAKVLTK